MESRVDLAALKKKSGYNCAQAIASTYCDIAGVDEETMLKLGQAFGTGLGNMEGTCGAILGACAIVGLMNENRAEAMQQTREIMDKFIEKNKSAICKELKGIETGVVLQSCENCVKDATKFLESIID